MSLNVDDADSLLKISMAIFSKIEKLFLMNVNLIGNFSLSFWKNSKMHMYLVRVENPCQKAPNGPSSSLW